MEGNSVVTHTRTHARTLARTVADISAGAYVSQLRSQCQAHDRVCFRVRGWHWQRERWGHGLERVTGCSSVACSSSGGSSSSDGCNWGGISGIWRSRGSGDGEGRGGIYADSNSRRRWRWRCCRRIVTEHAEPALLQGTKGGAHKRKKKTELRNE